MRETLGYMVTWTTYGSWLQGEKKGYVKDGEIKKANPKLMAANKAALVGEPVRLNKKQRKIVEGAILEEASKWRQYVYAIAVCSNHVHMVLGYNGREIGRSVRRYKNAGYFALRKNGFKGKVWTRGYDKRYCYDKDSLRKRIDYVQGHNKG